MKTHIIIAVTSIIVIMLIAFAGTNIVHLKKNEEALKSLIEAQNKIAALNEKLRLRSEEDARRVHEMLTRADEVFKGLSENKNRIESSYEEAVEQLKEIEDENTEHYLNTPVPDSVIDIILRHGQCSYKTGCFDKNN